MIFIKNFINVGLFAFCVKMVSCRILNNPQFQLTAENVLYHTNSNNVRLQNISIFIQINLLRIIIKCRMIHTLNGQLII